MPIPRWRSRRLSMIALGPLVILTMVVAQELSLPTRGQTLRPAVRIAFVHHGNIWVLDTSSGRRIRLTAGGNDSSPRWAPNGQALIFQRSTGRRLETVRWQSGQGTHRLRAGLWSPDGTAVAFARTAQQAGSATAVWVSYHGQTVRITPVKPGFRWYPLAWSPDSARLALARFAASPPAGHGQEIPATSASLWVAGAPSTTQLRRLPMPSVSPGHPGWPDIAFWSPDGRFLTVGVGPAMQCESCRADGRPYAVIPSAGGKVVRLGTSLAPGEAISWAPDGSYVVLSSPAGRETYANKHLFWVDPVTGTHRALTRDSRWADIEPAISPDGQRIAFVRGRAESPHTHPAPLRLIATRHIFLMDARGASPYRLTRAPGWTDEAPVWSPDGQWLLFVRWRRHQGSRTAQAALWTVRADGSRAQRLAPLDLPGDFLNGFGFYGTFGWRDLFAVAPKSG